MRRYLAGETPQSICVRVERSRSWLYKWVERYDPNDPDWYRERSKRPHGHPHRTPQEVVEAIKLVRLSLYNQGLFCGAQAIHWELEELGVRPLPSLRTTNRILSREGLTHRRTGRYEPKGTPYPQLPANRPNQRHQSDFLGPRYLRGYEGTVRFYSLNTVDLATARSAIEPLLSRNANAVYEAIWATWWRLGVPEHLQVDNEFVFYGSPIHPRGMGPLIRLCLHHGTEPWFIPMGEPWRNGVVEKFNDHYRKKFLTREPMHSAEELHQGSLAFECKHNGRYRYSKLMGQTPNQTLVRLQRQPLRFPPSETPPRYPLPKPHAGRYHLIRFIRSDGQLDVFGERFLVAPELHYEYVVATIDVKEQRLKLFLDNCQVEEFDYRLR